MPSPRKRSAPPRESQSYRHPEALLPAWREIVAQARFKQARSPIITYRFDSSCTPALEWDVQLGDSLMARMLEEGK